MAAALVALVVAHVETARPQSYQIATGPGERREISIGQGTTIALNGDTVVILDRRDPRSAELRRGEALFTVRHDDLRPFSVVVGRDRVVDIGTSFDVLRAEGSTSVAVAQGSVRYEGGGSIVTLQRGEVLRVADQDRVAVRSAVHPDMVAGWQRGQFGYDGAALSKVAADLTRYVGARVRVSGDLAAQPFSGVISVSDPRDLSSLGSLFRAHVRRDGSGWLISRR